jgi:hypothetical protein
MCVLLTFFAFQFSQTLRTVSNDTLHTHTHTHTHTHANIICVTSENTMHLCHAAPDYISWSAIESRESPIRKPPILKTCWLFVGYPNIYDRSNKRSCHRMRCRLNVWADDTSIGEVEMRGHAHFNTGDHNVGRCTFQRWCPLSVECHQQFKVAALGSVGSTTPDNTHRISRTFILAILSCRER